MTKKEKLMMVLRGMDIGNDLLSGYWIHFCSKYQRGKASVQAHIDYLKKTDTDILKVMNEHLYQLDTEIHSPKDWNNLQEIKAENSFYSDYLDEIKMVRKEIGNGIPLFATIHGILVSACHATDGLGHFNKLDNLITKHLNEDPEATVKGLHKIMLSLDDLCRACIEAGADGIYYAALGGEAHRFKQPLFETFVKPLEHELLSRAKERGLVVLHICKANVRLPMYQGYPGDIVNWAVHECEYKLSDGRELFPEATILGGFNARTGALINGTEQEIYQEMDSMLKEVGRKKFIFGADCTLPTNISYEQIKIATDAARNIAYV